MFFAVRLGAGNEQGNIVSKILSTPKRNLKKSFKGTPLPT